MQSFVEVSQVYNYSLQGVVLSHDSLLGFIKKFFLWNETLVLDIKLPFPSLQF